MKIFVEDIELGYRDRRERNKRGDNIESGELSYAIAHCTIKDRKFEGTLKVQLNQTKLRKNF